MPDALRTPKALGWLLADSRLPAGSHAHSGGVEQAIDAGLVVDATSLRTFLEGRIATATSVGAELAAASCATCAAYEASGSSVTIARWTDLDAEADARTPSPAQRLVSRRQGRAFLRLGRRLFGSPALDAITNATGEPHLPVAHGSVWGAAGLSPADAASAFAYSSTAGAATAATRLLGLDPVDVTTLLVELAPSVDAVASRAALAGEGPFQALAASSSPILDLLAEEHHARRDRLFAS